MTTMLDEELLQKLINGSISDPHAILGMHPLSDEEKIIRLWRPGASKAYLEVRGEILEVKKEHSAGLFSIAVPKEISNRDYRVYQNSGKLIFDPYAFLPTFGDMDAFLFNKGVHYELYNTMGARVCYHQGCRGVKFAVWAPSAKGVALVGDFNYWDGRANPMRSMGSSGVWELFIPDFQQREKYKFEIRTQEEHIRLKSDPFGLYMEKRPSNASIVWDIDKYQWKDADWMMHRRNWHFWESPMNIYEVHLGSWKRPYGQFKNYREIGEELGDYCKDMGYTHIELLPILEHPLDESWGYQVTGFYSVTSRFGTPEDFQYFVDILHQKGIGVIIDWVPAHFPADDHALARFDGTYLYEHADPRQGFHPHWNTLIFNYGRLEVSNFLIASALFWLSKMHVDGLRVDAVASMLYLDYGRNPGEWIPNKYGGNENLEAIEFIRHLNSIVHEKFPGVLMIAEESTAFFGVSHPLHSGGLGFDLKWNMGWMNDTLRYIETDPLFRKFHHGQLTFTFIYVFHERFVLVFSHDEVVHGKRSLLSKMPGDDWQRFANLRLLYGYMICYPGKKLLFMGSEFGQWNEWYCNEEIHWHLLNFETHRGLHRCVKALNHFYLENPSLWEYEFDYNGFRWIDYGNADLSMLSFIRFGKTGKPLACISNFTPNYYPSFFIPLAGMHSIREVFNTDHAEFGGTNKCNSLVNIQKNEKGEVIGFNCQIAPLAQMIFEVEFE